MDVVFEHVGAATWQNSVASLAPGGRLVTCGATTGYDVKLDLRFLFSKQYSLLGSFMGSLGELHRGAEVRLPQAVAAGDRPRLSALAEIRAAHERLENKEQFGKVIVTP